MVTEVIVNLKNEILKYAASKVHDHDQRYFKKEDTSSFLKTSDANNNYAPKSHTTIVGNSNTLGHVKVDTSVTNSDNPVSGKGILNKINDVLENYSNTDQVQSLIQEKISTLSPNFEGHSLKVPKSTNVVIDHLVTPGYYINNSTNNVTFTCSPDVVSYRNALIKVLKQSNHIVQYVYATSKSTSTTTPYKIDGRVFIRYGYTTTVNNETQYKWGKWYAHHIPYRERNDLLKNNGENVHIGDFKIYEVTGGYIFKWKQSGENQTYKLPVKQNTYTNVYTYKTLPIPNGYTVGNLMGHIDIRITDNAFKVRSINGKGEIISGVDVSYFVPRLN